MEYLITPVLLQSLGHHLGGWRQVGQPLPSHRTCWASPCLVLICYWVSTCHCWGKQDLANGQADQLNSNYLWSHLAKGWLKTCSFPVSPVSSGGHLQWGGDNLHHESGGSSKNDKPDSYNNSNNNTSHRVLTMFHTPKC